jgi:hypothetical protein
VRGPRLLSRFPGAVSLPLLSPCTAPRTTGKRDTGPQVTRPPHAHARRPPQQAASGASGEVRSGGGKTGEERASAAPNENCRGDAVGAVAGAGSMSMSVSVSQKQQADETTPGRRGVHSVQARAGIIGAACRALVARQVNKTDPVQRHVFGCLAFACPPCLPACVPFPSMPHRRAAWNTAVARTTRDFAPSRCALPADLWAPPVLGNLAHLFPV